VIDAIFAGSSATAPATTQAASGEPAGMRRAVLVR
jgi:hypothetical protein